MKAIKVIRITAKGNLHNCSRLFEYVRLIYVILTVQKLSQLLQCWTFDSYKYKFETRAALDS